MSDSMTRRSFLQKSGVAALGLTIVPNVVMGKNFSGVAAPSDKLNIAVVGAGGMGNSNLRAVKPTENIVALCDVDWKYSARVFGNNPDAKKYWDWRKMYDEMGKSIDAVIVATADHTHAIIAATAMTMGKHVYVQKPLTHTVYESRLLTKLAVKHKVATQMGNQGSSGAGVRQVCDWIAAGEIGEVTRVDCGTNRPIWPQGLNTPKQGQWVPDTLNWDLFTGPAKLVPFNEIYHPWNWRGWWNYGTGALGDMACHVMHPIFKGLKLGYPTRVQGSSTLLLADCAPTAQSVRLVFPARPEHNTEEVKYPEVEIYWTDGGITPLIPKGMPEDKKLDIDGPVIFHGTKDTLICGCYGSNPWLLSGRKPQSPKTQREVTLSHEMDWVRACKESPGNRIPTASDFSEAGPFNEMVVMGVLAVRLQGLNRELEWDGINMQFTNISDSDEISIVKSDDFKIEDGHPTFNKTTDKFNAKAFAQELIKHEYRAGWSLPAMP
jgi:predicted dehydrogenase